jgi:hypothetical protein
MGAVSGSDFGGLFNSPLEAGIRAVVVLELCGRRRWTSPRWSCSTMSWSTLLILEARLACIPRSRAGKVSC